MKVPNIFESIKLLTIKPSEIENRLEQLRAIENGIKINVGLAKFCPIGVDTMEDYLALKKKLEYNSWNENCISRCCWKL